MAGKSSKEGKSANKSDREPRQFSWTRVFFAIFALLLIVSMLLSAVVNNF